VTDEKYIKARNKLIPEAERYANEVHDKPIGLAENLAWSKTFLLKMDALAVKEGLIEQYLVNRGWMTLV
jgi:hypothetical protein